MNDDSPLFGSTPSDMTVEGWYFRTIWASSVVHGVLCATNRSVVMTDDQGNPVFDVAYSDLRKAFYKSGRLRLKTVHGNYLIALFDPRTTAGTGMARKGVIGVVRTQNESKAQGEALQQYINTRMS